MLSFITITLWSINAVCCVLCIPLGPVTDWDDLILNFEEVSSKIKIKNLKICPLRFFPCFSHLSSHRKNGPQKANPRSQNMKTENFNTKPFFEFSHALEYCVLLLNWGMASMLATVNSTASSFFYASTSWKQLDVPHLTFTQWNSLESNKAVKEKSCILFLHGGWESPAT